MTNTADSTVATSEIFSRAIRLHETNSATYDVAFLATTQPCPWPKAYGGDLIAQAAAAAMRSVSDGKVLNSMHSYFLRPTDIGAEIRYEVELLRDGRRYSTRHVRGFQNGKPVYVCLASFAAGGPGGSYHTNLDANFDADVAAPETLPTTAQYLSGRSGGTMTDESRAYWSFGRGFDMRHVPGPVYLNIEGRQTAHQAVWIRPFDELRPVAGLSGGQRDLAALAYVCDYTILEPLLRVLGHSWADSGLVTASLDHAMWFHRMGPIDDWLLYAQEAVASDGGRGVSIGRFFARDRTHLATVVQEGMINAGP